MIKLKGIHFWFVVLSPLMALGSVADHAYAASCTSDSCRGHITSISVFHATASNAATLSLDSSDAPAGCTLSGGNEWLIARDDTDMVKAILAAHLAGREVTLRYDDTAATCTVGYVTVW